MPFPPPVINATGFKAGPPSRRQINFINFLLIALRDRLAIDFDFLKNIDAAHFCGENRPS